MNMNKNESGHDVVVYVVTAVRHFHGQNDHKYMVGIFSNFESAREVADDHVKYRAGKYECIVEPVTLDCIRPDALPYKIGDTK